MRNSQTNASEEVDPYLGFPETRILTVLDFSVWGYINNNA
jgi:hypothetical protein